MTGMITELVDRLLDEYAGVTGIVGSRISPILATATESLPYITYQVVSTSELATVCGNTGDVQYRLQINCYAKTYAGVQSLADAVKVCLQAYTGTVIKSVLFTDRVDLPPVLHNGKENAGAYWVALEFSIWADES